MRNTLLATLIVSFSATAAAQSSTAAQQTAGPPSPAVPGTSFTAHDYIVPATAPFDYPYLAPWTFGHVVTRRYTYSDQLNGANVFLDYQHGGANFLSGDMGLPSHINGNAEDANAFRVSLSANTDVQDGGTFSIQTHHYGHGDTMAIEMDNLATGTSRGLDEANKFCRCFVAFHGNNWGISIVALHTDAMGQAVLAGPRGSDRVPHASPNHDLHAAMENGPLLDTNPAKLYSAGNAQLVASCPAGTPNPQFYMCVTGDAATAWTRHFGVSRMTTLTKELVDQPSPDPFASGPRCVDVAVADSGIFTVGQIFTISSREDNYEQPTVLGVGAGTLHACFAKPHAAGEMLSTGGAVGHALSFPLDDLAPGANPFSHNDSTLRLAYPVVASLPGNVMMLWVNASGSVDAELKTSALMATTPRVPASFTPNLHNGSIAAGRAGWTVHNPGDYRTRSEQHSGQDELPPPTISFAGSHCATLPTAHTEILQTDNGELNVAPVTDTPGVGCTAIAATLQATYANPVSLYPMLWARSNRDPDFVDSPYFQNVGINASTDGYMVAGGTTPEFAVGDSVEFGRWWQQYIQSDIWMGTPMGKSRRYGHLFNVSFVGVQSVAMFNLNNFTDPAKYYGNAETHWAPGIHGEGIMTPPVGYNTSGPTLYGYATELPQGRAGIRQIGAALEVVCRAGPCSQGQWPLYDIFQADVAGGQLYLRVDPLTHTTRLVDNSPGANSTGGSLQVNRLVADAIIAAEPGKSLTIDSTVKGDAAADVRLGTLQVTQTAGGVCDAAHRFQQRPVAGGPGIADSYTLCMKRADDTYAWRTLSFNP